MTNRPENKPVLDVCDLTTLFPVGGLVRRRHVLTLSQASFTPDRGQVVAL